MQTPLTGRLAVVTGAGMGIGQAIAIELARQGADVAIHYAHSAAGAEDTCAAIGEFGRRTYAFQADLGQVDEAQRAIERAADALGGLGILVNKAGVTRTLEFSQTTPEIYDEVFNLNMRGYFFCAQRAVEYMQRRGRGAIVNV